MLGSAAFAIFMIKPLLVTISAKLSTYECSGVGLSFNNFGSSYDG